MKRDVWNNLLSLKEASELYNREESTLRRAIENGLLQEGVDCKKFGKQWVILKSSMDRIYIKKEKGNLRK